MRNLRYHSARRLGAISALFLAGALGLAACGGAGAGGAYGGAYGGSPTATTGGSSSVDVRLQCASGATVCTKTVSVSGKSQTALADSKGMTLYYFTPDSATSATCSGSCAQLWPPLLETGGSVMGTGLSGALTSINGANGDQVVYNGHPLYRYSGDKSQSDTTGEGILGKWYVATSDLAASGGGSTPGASPSKTPGGYGAGGY